MSIEKPSKNEEEYFARQDLELLERQRRAVLAERAAAERRSHYMKCPKDGYDLTTGTYHGVSIETCPHCGGIWLDRGELAVIERHHDRPGLLGKILHDLFATLGHLERRVTGAAPGGQDPRD